MANQLKIARDLSLPAEFTGRRTGLFGISGSGKSNTATVIMERALEAGEQIVLVDPKGEGWGLRSTAAGAPSKFDVIIFGEPNGDIPRITEDHGPQLADFVVESGRSIVISLLGFESDQAERRFVAAFLRQLYRRKTKQTKKTRTLVVFEEAHLFMPEAAGRGHKGETAELAGACMRIVRQGRTAGLGSLIVDQRPQDVAKRAITQCDTLICHQLVYTDDKKKLRDWVKGAANQERADEFFSSLESLAPGEAWIWSPGWLKIFQRVKVDRRRSYDSGAAPDDKAAANVKRRPIDLAKLGRQLDEMVARNKSEDPKHLAARLAELETENRKLKSTAEHTAATKFDRAAAEKIVGPAVEKAVARAVADRDRHFEPLLRHAERDIAALHKRLKQIQTAATLNADELEAAKIPRPDAPAEISPSAFRGALDNSGNIIATLERRSPKLDKRAESMQSEDAAEFATLNGDLATGEKKILAAAIQFPDGVDQAQICVLTGYKATSRKEYLSRLRRRGYVETDGAKVFATEAGRAALPNAAPLPTGPDLVDYWRARLPAGELALLEILIEHYPNYVDPTTLGDLAGYKATSRKEYVSRLTRRHLATTSKTKGVRASDSLF